jgi:hypothetical protein
MSVYRDAAGRIREPKSGEVAKVFDFPKCDKRGCDADALLDFKSKYGPWANACKRHYPELAGRVKPRVGLGIGQWLVKKEGDS